MPKRHRRLSPNLNRRDYRTGSCRCGPVQFSSKGKPPRPFSQNDAPNTTSSSKWHPLAHSPPFVCSTSQRLALPQTILHLPAGVLCLLDWPMPPPSPLSPSLNICQSLHVLSVRLIHLFLPGFAQAWHLELRSLHSVLVTMSDYFSENIIWRDFCHGL